MTDGHIFSSIPIEIVVSVGKSKPLIRDLLKLNVNSVLELEKSVDDPVDLLIGDRKIAQGVLEERIEEGKPQLTVRVTSVSCQTEKFE